MMDNKKIYVNKRTKIKIICPEHGEFIKSVQKHQSGQGLYIKTHDTNIKKRGKFN